MKIEGIPTSQDKGVGQEKEKFNKDIEEFFEVAHDYGTKDKLYELSESNPKAFEEILESTKDSREVLFSLRNRASESLQSLGVELEWIEGIYGRGDGGYATSEGIEKVQQEAKPSQVTSPEGIAVGGMPNEFKDFRNWQDLHQYLMLKNRFEGLDNKQKNEILESEQDLEDVRWIRNRISSQLDRMALDNELGASDALSKLSYNKRLLRSKLYGKMQKLRFAPRFAKDKIEDYIDELKNNIRELL